MPGIALPSATKGRLRPSFFFCAAVWLALPGLAQQAVFRCGQEYTNAPVDPGRCERLAAQSVMVIPGTRVQQASEPVPVPVPTVSSASAASSPAAAMPPLRADAAPQRQRDEMARTIVAAELDKARQRLAQLQQEYRQGQPERTPEEVRQPDKYRERVARLQAETERVTRDIDSLQRELLRRPAALASSVTP